MVANQNEIDITFKMERQAYCYANTNGHSNLDSRLKRCPPPKIVKLFKCRIFLFIKWKNHQIRQDLTLNKTSLDFKTHIGIFRFVEQICMLHHKKIEWKIEFWIYNRKKSILSLKNYNIQNHAKGE